MNEDDLRSMLRYDSSDLRLPPAADLIKNARRRQRRRQGLVVGSGLSVLIVGALALQLHGNDPAGDPVTTLVGSAPTSAPPSSGPASPQPTATFPGNPADNTAADVGPACRALLTGRGVLHGTEGHNVVRRQPSGWLVQVWPDSPAQVPDGAVPPGVRWECDVTPTGPGLAGDLLIAQVRQVKPLPGAAVP